MGTPVAHRLRIIVSLDDAVVQYVPNLAGSAHEGVTIRSELWYGSRSDLVA